MTRYDWSSVRTRIPSSQLLIDWVQNLPTRRNRSAQALVFHFLSGMQGIPTYCLMLCLVLNDAGSLQLCQQKPRLSIPYR